MVLLSGDSNHILPQTALIGVFSLGLEDGQRVPCSMMQRPVAPMLGQELLLASWLTILFQAVGLMWVPD